MKIEHIPGKKGPSLMLYALSTCIWCRKTRQLLEDIGVEYDYLYVDQLQGNERQQAIDAVKKWNPACTFPTLVIDNKYCITGFKEEEIRKALS
ncbi:MAG: glutaredoxin family protein [Dehalococcoidia bacterium]|nr:glutaredoxin family protein [Dehalococcoidia bacterium]